MLLISRGVFENGGLAKMSVRDLTRSGRLSTAKEFDLRALSGDAQKQITCWECGGVGHKASSHRRKDGKGKRYEKTGKRNAPRGATKPPLTDGPDDHKIHAIEEVSDESDAESGSSIIIDDSDDADSTATPEGPPIDEIPDFL